MEEMVDSDPVWGRVWDHGKQEFKQKCSLAFSGNGWPCDPGCLDGEKSESKRTDFPGTWSVKWEWKMGSVICFLPGKSTFSKLSTHTIPIFLPPIHSHSHSNQSKETSLYQRAILSKHTHSPNIHKIQTSVVTFLKATLTENKQKERNLLFSEWGQRSVRWCVFSPAHTHLLCSKQVILHYFLKCIVLLPQDHLLP